MPAFLITFIPASENAKRGWPLADLLNLVQRIDRGEAVEENWRFHNRKGVSIGDRVFLLLQGRWGPAIIGYGQVCGAPTNAKQVPIRFDRLVNPSAYALVTREELQAIEGSGKFWRTNASGIALSNEVTSELEALLTVAGSSVKTPTHDDTGNPDWTRDELILALNVYLQHRSKLPNKGSDEIAKLSQLLNRLGDTLFSARERSSTFRNVNGVYMKLMNFRRHDPDYLKEGKTGLSRGANAEADVWAEFGVDPPRCAKVAAVIVSSLDDPEVSGSLKEYDTEQLEEAEEGRLLTRKHVTRERNRQLVKSKLKQVMKKLGRLACEACDFEFADRYGRRGEGFIECHHTKPVATLAAGDKTHINDLALVCANCHRMIHRNRPWLSIEQLKALM